MHLLFLVGNGIYAMEAGSDSIPIISDKEAKEDEPPLLRLFPPEIDHEIMSYISQKPFEIATHDAMRDIGEYTKETIPFQIPYPWDRRLLVFIGPRGVVSVYEHPIEDNYLLALPGPEDGEIRIINRDTVISETFYNPNYHVYEISFPSEGHLCVLVNLKDGTSTRIDIPIDIRFTVKIDGAQVSDLIWSPDCCLLAVVRDNKIATIKSMVSLLLAQYCCAKTIGQYLLIKELQQQLLDKKEPLIIGQEKWNILDEMPSLKKLLKVEKSLAKTKNPIWHLTLQERMSIRMQDID